MGFHQGIHPQAFCHQPVFLQLAVAENGGDQQDGISPQGPGLDHHVGIDGEVLPEQGCCHRLADFPEIPVAAQEMIRFRQDGNGGGAQGFILSGNGHIGEIQGNEPFGRRGFLHFSNEVQSRFLQSLPEAAGPVPGQSFRFPPEGEEILFLFLFFHPLPGGFCQGIQDHVPHLPFIRCSL